MTKKIFVVEHLALRQMKENYQTYLPYQFRWRPQLVDPDTQLPQKKRKSHVSLEKSKTNFDFFPNYW